MNNQNALKSNAQTGTPSLQCILLMYLENIKASSLANDQVKRELVVTLPMAVIKPETIMHSTNMVAAVLELVA